uniref:Uncharacterized protein n=1 Tax=Eutreptiella gymnastica TaxID=73025 RepID=A0A7S1IZE5_9EUGL|mmetsp:Transcript_5496/g.9792  ORF Transcript_5496/g.9792 Transcript_5496/m.9792 type:complete len:148 (+) Transcript_5496:3-446(+)
MARDLEGWLATNHLYAGTAEALLVASQAAPVFVITTKQQHFAQALLRNAGVTLPDDRVYGLGMYKDKLEVLLDLLGRPEYAGHVVHFVEDRYPTLEAVHEPLKGRPVQCHLATWGYNTEEVRQLAATHGHVALLGLEAFCAMLRSAA